MMEKNLEAVDDFWKLVNPLFLPDLNRNLNIRAIYEQQGILKNIEEKQDNTIETEEFQEDQEKKKIDKYNELYIRIMDTLINFTIAQSKKTTFKELLNALGEEKLESFTYDRLIFTILLKLYDIGIIDVGAWFQSEEAVIINPSEEFSIEYCLYKLIDTNANIEKLKLLKVYKNPECEELNFQYIDKTNENNLVKQSIHISNFIIEVVMKLDKIKTAVKIFRILVENGELNRGEYGDLFVEYLDSEVQIILNSFEDEMDCSIKKIGNTVYLLPNYDNSILGFRNKDWREWIGSTATNVDVYLAYYITMYTLFKFYGGKNKNPKRLEFLRIVNLIEDLDRRFETLLSEEEAEVRKKKRK